MGRKVYLGENVCFYCEEKILKEEDVYVVGVDIPYINLKFHRDCFQKIFAYGEEKYLQENKNKIFALAKESAKK
jgi:hypothetical protein